MSFINPNFRKISRKEIKKETDELEVLDINFNNVKLTGEPRRYDLNEKKEDIVSLNEILEKQYSPKYEFVDSPNIANLNGVPKIEELNLNKIAKIQIKYFENIGNTMSM